MFEVSPSKGIHISMFLLFATTASRMMKTVMINKQLPSQPRYTKKHYSDFLCQPFKKSLICSVIRVSLLFILGSEGLLTFVTKIPISS